MWLLDTEHYSLRRFDKPPARYAILSHVWRHSANEPEQTFSDIRSIRSSKNLSGKLRHCCKHARRQGIHWVWVDTCCIDRTNSVEISESINRMFEWYSNATVCYAFLYDVKASENPAELGSSFRQSKWFTRAWTLPELLAPRNMVFFASDWTTLGTKAFLVDILADITGIDVDVLTLCVPLSSVAVATRMSWAAKRQARHQEDLSYSLLGIFNVKMPTVYGEGDRAFRRLQEEIMRTCSDQTLYTWGHSVVLSRSPHLTSQSLPLNSTVDSTPSLLETLRTEASHVPLLQFDGGNPSRTTITPDTNLLAPSPSAFTVAPPAPPQPVPIKSNIFLASLKGMNFERDRASDNTTAPEFWIGGQGIQARVPLIPVPSRRFVQTSSYSTTEYYLTPLTCTAQVTARCDPSTKESSSAVSILCLVLSRPTELSESSSDVYEVGADLLGEGFTRYLIVNFSDPSWNSFINLKIDTMGPQLEASRWKGIRIAQPILREHSVRASPAYSEGHGAQFIIIPRWIIQSLENAGFKSIHPDKPHEAKLVSATQGHMFVFQSESLHEEVRVHAGWCPGSAGEERGLWLSVEIVDITTEGAVLIEDIHDLLLDVGADKGTGHKVKNSGATGDATSSKSSENSAQPCCNRVHVRDWDATGPLFEKPAHRPALDDRGLRWARYRTFSKLNRVVHLRVVDAGAGNEGPEADQKDKEWVVGVEVETPWGRAVEGPFLEIPPSKNMHMTYPPSSAKHWRGSFSRFIILKPPRSGSRSKLDK